MFYHGLPHYRQGRKHPQSWEYYKNYNTTYDRHNRPESIKDYKTDSHHRSYQQRFVDNRSIQFPQGRNNKHNFLKTQVSHPGHTYHRTDNHLSFRNLSREQFSTPRKGNRQTYIPIRRNNTEQIWKSGEHHSRHTGYNKYNGPTFRANDTKYSTVQTNRTTLHKWRSTKKKDTQTNRKGETDHVNAEDDQSQGDPEKEKFRIFVKKLFEILRSYHHLEKISSDSDLEPPTFSRLTRYLTEIVKPANNTTQTKSLLEGNAKNWAYTTRLILQGHYEAHIDQETETLLEMMEENWSIAFDIAVKWYRRRYTKKCMEGPVKRLQALLQAFADRPEVKGDVEIVEETPERERPPQEEDFPPLGHSTSSSSRKVLSPFPLALPQRASKKSHKKQGVSKQKSKQANPGIIHTTDHPELTEVQSYPETQGTGTPSLIHEPRADTPHASLPVVEVQMENYKPAANESADQGPPFSPVEQTADNIPSPVHSICSILNIDSECTNSPEPQANQSNKPKTFKPVKHVPTNRKMIVWGLNIRKKWCILGDSNLARITEHHFENIEIHSYPGATFRHAEALINKAHIQVQVETVILSFGINHRNQKFKETAVKQIQGALRAARERFPGARIRIPLINFSKKLNKQERALLEGINDHVQRNMPYLHKLPSEQFEVTSDDIHWTPTCAKAMLQHWTEQLNYTAL